MAESNQSASAPRRLITVFGGTGFLGRRAVRHLLDDGFAVRVASRHPDRTQSRSGPNGASPEAMLVDVHDETSVAAALAGADGAVNAVSRTVSVPVATAVNGTNG